MDYFSAIEAIDNLKKPKKLLSLKNIPKKLLLVILLFLCLASFIVIAYFAFFQTTKYVSNDTMKQYAITLISTYKQDVDSLLKNSPHDDFSFYSNEYQVKTVISTIHGAALLLDPSNRTTFESNNTVQTIELALFGGDLSLFPMFRVPAGTVNCTIAGGTFYTNNHPFIQIEGNGTILFSNLIINSHYHSFIVLCGSNETEYWTSQRAKDVSEMIFRNELSDALQNSEIVKQRYAEPELIAMLEKIIDKLRLEKLEYTYLDFLNDMKNVEQVAANKYGITQPNDFVNNLLNFLKDKTEIPAKQVFGIDDPDNWVFVGFLGSLPVIIYAMFLTFDYLRNRFPSKSFRYMLGIPLTMLIIALGDLVWGHPNDYQLFSIQTFVVVVIWIIGGLVVYESKKRLILWRATKESYSHRDKQKSKGKNKREKARKNRNNKKSSGNS